MKMFKKLLYCMVIVLIGTVLFLLYIDKKVTIIVEKYIEDEVERLTTNIVSKSISNNITNKRDNSFIKIDKYNNEIKNIEYNIIEINRIKHEVLNDINKRLMDLENGKVDDVFFADRIIKGKFNKREKGVLYDVNLAAIRKSSLFGNIGPTIPIKLMFIGQTTTDIDVIYKNYGINNIIVQINLIVIVKEQIVMPVSSKRKTITIREPIYMNIIKGDIPNYYGADLK